MVLTKHQIQQTVFRFWKYGYCTPNRKERAFEMLLVRELFYKNEKFIKEQAVIKNSLILDTKCSFVYGNHFEECIIHTKPLYPSSSTMCFRNLYSPISTFARNVLKNIKFIDITRDEILNKVLLKKELFRTESQLMQYLTKTYLGNRRSLFISKFV